MAGEKRGSVNFSVSKNGQTYQQNISVTGDLAGKVVQTTQSIATGSYQAITITPVSTLQKLILANQDATNFIDIASSSDGTKKVARLTKSGDITSYCDISAASSATYYAQADTATCILSILAMEA